MSNVHILNEKVPIYIDYIIIIIIIYELKQLDTIIMIYI